LKGSHQHAIRQGFNVMLFAGAANGIGLFSFPGLIPKIVSLFTAMFLFGCAFLTRRSPFLGTTMAAGLVGLLCALVVVLAVIDNPVRLVGFADSGADVARSSESPSGCDLFRRSHPAIARFLRFKSWGPGRRRKAGPNQ
jgi:hypothetical protein